MPEIVELAHEDALKPNEQVRIHGLLARPELNGLVGRVLMYESSKQRYAVELPGQENKILLKLANLQLTTVEDVAPPVAEVGIAPSKYTANRGTAAPATAEDDAAGDVLDYDTLLAGVDFAALRDQLLRAGSRPGCAPMPGRLLRKLPADRSCLVGIVSILQRSKEGPPELVQQACDALSRLCTTGAAGRSAVRRSGAAPALVHAVRNPPPAAAPEPATATAAAAKADVTAAGTDAGLPTAPPPPPSAAAGEGPSATASETAAASNASSAATTRANTPAGLTVSEAVFERNRNRHDPTLVPRAACHALTNLANGDLACKDAVASNDGAAALVGTLKGWEKDELIAKLCVGGLANIAGGDANCVKAVLKAKAVQEVLRVLKQFGSQWPDLAADCCLALANFAAGKGDGAAAVVDHGGVPALVAALKVHCASAPRVREWGAAALANLASAKDDDITETLVETPAAIRAAVSALEHAAPSEGRTLHFAIGMWAHLGQANAEASEACVSAGFVEATLKRVLETTPSPGREVVPFLEEACRSMATLAFADAEGRSTLRDAGAIKVLTLLLERFSTEHNVQEMGRALLSEITK